MKNHSNLSGSMQETTQVVALRVPHATYVILLERSKDWEMSVSSLIRELVIKVFHEKCDEEMNRIKSYRKRSKKG